MRTIETRSALTFDECARQVSAFLLWVVKTGEVTQITFAPVEDEEGTAGWVAVIVWNNTSDKGGQHESETEAGSGAQGEVRHDERGGSSSVT